MRDINQDMALRHALRNLHALDAVHDPARIQGGNWTIRGLNRAPRTLDLIMSNTDARLKDRDRATRASSKKLWGHVLLSGLVLCGMALSNPAQTQTPTYQEIEPNNPCTSAQDLRSAASPLQIVGYKTQQASTAVDFFRFHGTPRTQGRISLNGDFSKPMPLTSYGLGFFTSECPGSPQGIAFGFGSEVFLDFTVPDNGEFVIGVTACCDLNFSGSGTLEGAYVLSVSGTTAGLIDPVPINATPAGRSYGQWAAAFWQWVLSVPDNKYPAQSGNQRVNPLKDTTGAQCSAHQIGDVWFLAGSWVGPVTRSCTIPAGKALYVPLIDNVYVGFLSDPPEQRTEQFAHSNAACTEPAVISASLDGIPVKDPTTFFTGSSGSQSPAFNVQMPFGTAQGGPGNLLESLGFKIKDVPEWFLSPSAEQGYYLFYNALPPGTHTLRWKASGCTAGGAQDVTYNLTVGTP